MKKNITPHSREHFSLNRSEKEDTKQENIPACGIVQLILGLINARHIWKHCACLSLVLFFSFLCMMPQIAQAQQTTSKNKEKTASVVSSHSEEEEEGTEEAAREHENSKWYKGMQKKNANYIKLKKSYDNYFKKQPDEQSKPRQLYQGWLKTNLFYLDKKGRVQDPPAINYNGVQKLVAVPWATVTDTMAGDWRMLGPRNTFQTNYSGIGNRGGYVNCVKIDPNDPNKLFVGFQQGGLWVSKDGGTVWQLSDKNLPDKGYMDLDVCKANSNIAYAISYDNSNKNAAVIKSTDGGLSWIPTALNSTNYAGKSYDIALSATNPDIVVARWGTELYRTTDGGATWASVLTGLKNYSPTNGSGSKSEVLDFHQANDNLVYHLDRSDNQTYVTLYRSDNFGASFTNLGNINIPAAAQGTSNINAAKLLTASNTPDVLYIAMGSNGKDANGADLNSIHLIKLNPTTGAILLTRVNMITGFALSSGDIAMDINNENIIVHGAYGPSKTNYSSDNGATFKVSTTSVHADLRALSIVNGKVLLGTDGEAVYSTDGGNIYTSLTASISNHELWGFGASHKTGILGAGLNHGPLAIREHEGPGGWYNAMGADQQNTDVNPLDDKYLYSRGYDTYHVVRTGPHTMTSGGGQQEIDPGREDSFNTMSFHPNLYYTLITHHGGVKPANNPNLALWKKSLIRSDDNGVTINKIIKTFDTDVRREAICMTDANRIYVVEGFTGTNKLWKTTDAGVTWTNITPSTAVTGTNVRTISDIAVSDVSANEIWVTYSGVQNTCQVLHSTDGGLTYTNLTTPILTTWPVTKILFQRGTNGGVYVGNRTGVFYRNNSMNEWKLIGNGLVMTDVRWMFINYFKGKLLIGTNRGAWEHDVYELTAPKAQISASTNKIVKDGAVKFADYSVLHNDAQTSYSWSFPGGSPSASTAENPVVNYSVPGSYNVTLTVTDQYGTSTQTLTDFINVDGTTLVTTGSVTPVADSYVRDGGSESTNFGTATGLTVKKDGTGYSREIYLKFDLNTLPSTADKVSLKLNVATAGTTVTGTNWQVYYVPTDSWTETDLTWNNKPAPSTLLNTVQGKSSGTVEWDITSQALAELGGDKILSVKIVSTVLGGTRDATLSSKEEENVNLRPLIVTSVIDSGPTVSITSPAANALFTEGTNVTINANATTDNDGMISKVEFYQGTTLLGQSTNAPYSFTWNSVVAGTYTLTAKATDSNNKERNSSAVNITVNAAPTVSITSPTTNAVFTIGSNVTINATAADTDGTISKVEFYQGSTLLGESTVAPYSWSTINLDMGTYVITARVTDNSGLTTDSAPITITVKDLTAPVITCPGNIQVNNDANQCGAIVDFAATATDNFSFVAISYSQDPGSLFPTGSTIITATAIDTAGNSSTCTFTVTVKDSIAPTIVCPENIVLSACDPTATWSLPVVNDNCSDAVLTQTAGPSSGSTFENGTITTISYEVKDAGGNASNCSFTVTRQSTLDLTVSNSNPQLYYGYSMDQSSTITGIPTGGLTPYTVSITMDRPLKSNVITSSGDEIWTVGANNSVTATLMETAIFTVTVTDANGCSVSKTTTVNAEDTRCFAGNNTKVKICHKPENNNSCVELCVDQSAVQAHLDHGDFLGSCTPNCTTPITAKVVKLDKEIVETTAFKVITYPNPTDHHFTLVLEGGSNEKIDLLVYDMLGRKVKHITRNAEQSIEFGEELPTGEYLTVVKQGDNIQTVNLLKK